jgi:hypothetical protein
MIFLVLIFFFHTGYVGRSRRIWLTQLAAKSGRGNRRASAELVAADNVPAMC